MRRWEGARLLSRSILLLSRSPNPPSTHSSTLFTPPGIKAHGSESSDCLPPPRGRTGDSPITRSPLLILITPLRPFLSNKTLIQVLRGTGSLLLAGRRAEKKWVRALLGWAQPLGPVLATGSPPWPFPCPQPPLPEHGRPFAQVVSVLQVAIV